MKTRGKRPRTAAAAASPPAPARKPIKRGRNKTTTTTLTTAAATSVKSKEKPSQRTRRSMSTMTPTSTTSTTTVTMEKQRDKPTDEFDVEKAVLELENLHAEVSSVWKGVESIHVAQFLPIVLKKNEVIRPFHRHALKLVSSSGYEVLQIERNAALLRSAVRVPFLSVTGKRDATRFARAATAAFPGIRGLVWNLTSTCDYSGLVDAVVSPADLHYLDLMLGNVQEPGELAMLLRRVTSELPNLRVLSMMFQHVMDEVDTAYTALPDSSGWRICGPGIPEAPAWVSGLQALSMINHSTRYGDQLRQLARFMIPNMPRLLDLTLVSLQGGGAEYPVRVTELAPALRQCTQLRRLTLSGSLLGVEGGRDLASALPALTELRELQLITASDMFAMIDELMGNSPNQPKCEIGDVVQVDVLKHLQKLQVLRLNNSRLRDPEVRRLSRCFVHLRDLEELDLGGNMFTNQGAAALAAKLPTASKLHTLSVKSCKVGAAGEVALLKSAALLPKLRKLPVFSLPTSLPTAVRALGRLPELRSLELNHPVTQDVLKPLDDALAGMTRLQVLRVSLRDLVLTEQDSFCRDLLKNKPELLDLDLQLNEFSLPFTHEMVMQQLAKQIGGGEAPNLTHLALRDVGCHGLATLPLLKALNARPDQFGAFELQFGGESVFASWDVNFMPRAVTSLRYELVVVPSLHQELLQSYGPAPLSTPASMLGPPAVAFRMPTLVELTASSLLSLPMARTLLRPGIVPSELCEATLRSKLWPCVMCSRYTGAPAMPFTQVYATGHGDILIDAVMCPVCYYLKLDKSSHVLRNPGTWWNDARDHMLHYPDFIDDEDEDDDDDDEPFPHFLFQ